MPGPGGARREDGKWGPGAERQVSLPDLQAPLQAASLLRSGELAGAHRCPSAQPRRGATGSEWASSGVSPGRVQAAAEHATFWCSHRGLRTGPSLETGLGISAGLRSSPSRVPGVGAGCSGQTFRLFSSRDLPSPTPEWSPRAYPGPDSLSLGSDQREKTKEKDPPRRKPGTGCDLDFSFDCSVPAGDML